MNKLKEEYNALFDTKSAKKTNMTSILNDYRPAPSVHDVASLLKAFFKELAEPVEFIF